MRPVAQEIWDERIAQVDARWLGPVGRNSVPVEAECLSCRHRWMVRPGNVQQGKGCPNCAGQSVSQSDRDRQAAQVDVRWTEPVKNAHSKTGAECTKCGHQWKVSATSIASGSGCPACWSNRRHLAKLKSQSEHDSEAADAGLEWLEPVKKSTTKARAVCLTCGHEWMAKPARVQQGSGCPRCGIKKSTDARRTPLARRDAQARSAGLEWLEPVSDNTHKALARCLTCSHEWKVTGAQVSRGHGCPNCKATANRIPQAERDRQAASAGLIWLEPVMNSSELTLARCLSCEKEWRTYPDTVSRGSGCPDCAERGFNPSKPAYVYLVVRDDGVAQVGITGQGKPSVKRLRVHRLNGYQLVEKWPFEVGADAHAVEQETIRRWREEDDLLPAAPEGEDGWTETVHTDSLPLREIQKSISQLARELGAV